MINIRIGKMIGNVYLLIEKKISGGVPRSIFIELFVKTCEYSGRNYITGKSVYQTHSPNYEQETVIGRVNIALRFHSEKTMQFHSPKEALKHFGYTGTAGELQI